MHSYSQLILCDETQSVMYFISSFAFHRPLPYPLLAPILMKPRLSVSINVVETIDCVNAVCFCFFTCPGVPQLSIDSL